jgi:EGF domain
MCKIACLVKNPCGANALCSNENHKQTCHCQPGYTGNAKIGCVLIDSCRKNPCAPGALCQNTRGSYKCTCPKGTIGDPMKEGCKPALECEKSIDCPNAAKCILKNGIPKCQDACETILCGKNADCISQNHTAKCVCQNDFEGDANNFETGCIPKSIPCISSIDCSKDTYCYDNVCKRKKFINIWSMFVVKIY